MEGQKIRFFVVIPTLNAETFISQTIMTVVSAAQGSAKLFLHVQDGLSGDNTIGVARETLSTLGGLPNVDLEFSFSVEIDSGAAEAVNSGFTSLLEAHPELDDTLDICLWLGSDDGLCHNAFASMKGIVEAMGDDSEGFVVFGAKSRVTKFGDFWAPRVSPINLGPLIRSGSCHGQAMPIFQSEGAFFSRSVWSRVNGLDATLTYAWDYDFWLRASSLFPVVSYQGILGYHRRREGQLSSYMVNYWKELSLKVLHQLIPSYPDENDFVLTPSHHNRFEKVIASSALTDYPGRPYLIYAERGNIAASDNWTFVENSEGLGISLLPRVTLKLNLWLVETEDSQVNLQAPEALLNPDFQMGLSSRENHIQSQEIPLPPHLRGRSVAIQLLRHD